MRNARELPYRFELLWLTELMFELIPLSYFVSEISISHLFGGHNGRRVKVPDGEVYAGEAISTIRKILRFFGPDHLRNLSQAGSATVE